MRRLICYFKGHDPEPVTLIDPFFIVPGSGIFAHYRADPDGEHFGCRRCRRVPL